MIKIRRKNSHQNKQNKSQIKRPRVNGTPDNNVNLKPLTCYLLLMAYFYLDIETFSEGATPNPIKDKIITIQYQEMNANGTPAGSLNILKEWEKGEEGILKEFIPLLKPWSFIPVGNNLNYERKFLKTKCLQHAIPFDIYDFTYNSPAIDIQSLFVILNKGQFKGCGMHNFTSKKTNGSVIAPWYRNKEYDKIEQYIKEETEAFLEFYQKCHEELPKVFPKR